MNPVNNAGYAARICSALVKSLEELSPIQGYEQLPLVSLESAVEPIEMIVPDVQQMVATVKYNCKKLLDNLSLDESASIRLYTRSWSTEEGSFYYILNRVLRSENLTRIRPWFLYLKLCVTALSKLPFHPQTIYRGVRENLVMDYPSEKFFFWWQFNSCTSSIDVLQSNLFLGKTGKRTIFSIDSKTAKNISHHSEIQKEYEVLLSPGCQFQVIACLDMGHDLHMIQILEVEQRKNVVPKPVLQRNTALNNILSEYQAGKMNKQYKTLTLTNIKLSSQDVAILSSTIRNSQFLEELKCSEGSLSDTARQHSTSAINESALKSLDLSSNNISDEGIIYLVETIKTNTKLIQLSLSGNRISNTSVLTLSDILNHPNSTLEVLNLSSNEAIDDESIPMLTAILETNQSLKKLDLRDCGFSEDGERALHSLAKSKKRCRLWLSRIM